MNIVLSLPCREGSKLSLPPLINGSFHLTQANTNRHDANALIEPNMRDPRTERTNNKTKSLGNDHLEVQAQVLARLLTEVQFYAIYYTKYKCGSAGALLLKTPMPPGEAPLRRRWEQIYRLMGSQPTAHRQNFHSGLFSLVPTPTNLSTPSSPSAFNNFC